MKRIVLSLLTAGAAAVAVAQAPAPAKPEAGATAPAPKPAAVAAKRFASPEEATQALVAALRSGDTKVLVAVLGSEGRGLVISGDSVSDKQSREKFLQAYDAANKLVPSGATTVLQVGTDDWPFPIPLVKDGERWWFDARRGRAFFGEPVFGDQVDGAVSRDRECCTGPLWWAPPASIVGA